MRPRRSTIIGHVDHAGGGLIRGWATDLRDPQVRLALDVFRYGVFLGCARAGGLREDLRAQGIGDGRYGFVFHSDALRDACATAELKIIAPDSARTQLNVGNRAVAPARAADPAVELRSWLLPLIEDLAGSEPEEPMRRDPNHIEDHRLDILLAYEEESAISAFAAQIAAKYERSPGASPDDFWRWYLDVYGVEQAARPPLSIEDIAQITRIGLLDHGSRKNKAGHIGIRRSRAFAQAVHEARRLKLEDCLVGDRVAEALGSIPWMARRTAFPLSAFMRRLRSDHALLRAMSITTSFDRVIFYMIVMVLAVREALYLRYIPAVWADRMLSAAPDESLFERAQRTMLGGTVRPLTPERYRSHVRAAGFDLSTRRFETRRHKGHRLAVPQVSTGGSVVDLQMIGPFRQSLGLAESCRRIARALQASGLDVNFVDHPVGGMSRPGSPEVPLGAARKAKVNILHLNAEEVPEAMAYRPGVLLGGHTILIPYWELDRLSRAHRLGLRLVDEVWCTSRFLTDVFAGAAPVVHIGMSYDDRFAPRDRSPHRGFTILTVSDALSWTQRKNVLGAIDAFQAAFADADTRLVVKTRNAAAALRAAQRDDWSKIIARCADDPRITLLDTELSPEGQRSLLAGADCLLSLHRAEGLGLDILDALHIGTPVVATAYSGNMDVCAAETAWLVDYDRVPVTPGSYVFVEPGHMWAEPRPGSAIAALRAVRGDGSDRARRTAAAQAYVQRHASPDGLASRLSGRLREILGRRAA